MRAPEELAERAVVEARRCVDALIAFAGDGADRRLPEDAHRLVGRGRGDEFEGPTREAWERQAARDLLMAAKAEVLAEAVADDTAAPYAALRTRHSGYVALRGGDLESADQAASALLDEAARTPQGHWNHDNLVHEGHILRGLVRIAQDDIDAAARELLAAGAIEGSPQLNSFGPDLALAWELLKRGRDAEAIEYFHAIAKFWSPPRRRGSEH